MGFELLSDQMAFRNLKLLVFGVTGNANDLQPVEQRLRHAQRVGRAHEHHIREVIVDLEIMIVEIGILLGIQYFEQGRRRIAPEIRAHLVELIEHEERGSTSWPSSSTG